MLRLTIEGQCVLSAHSIDEIEDLSNNLLRRAIVDAAYRVEVRV